MHTSNYPEPLLSEPTKQQHGPLRRGCCSPQYSKIIFEYWPVEILEVAASTSEKVQPLLLTTYGKPASLHAIYIS